MEQEVKGAVRRYLDRVYTEMEQEHIESGDWYYKIWPCPKCGTRMWAEQGLRFGGGMGGGKAGCCWMMETKPRVEDTLELAAQARERFGSVVWWDRAKGVWVGGVIDMAKPYDKHIGLMYRHKVEYANHGDVVRELLRWITAEGTWIIEKDRDDGKTDD